MRTSPATLKFTLFLHYFVLSLLFTSTFTDHYSVASLAYGFGATTADAESLGIIKIVAFICAAIFGIGPAGRFGYLRLMGLSLLPPILITLLLSLTDSFLLVQLLYVFIGISWGLSLPASYAVLGELSADRREMASLINRFESIVLLAFGSSFVMFSWFSTLDELPSRQLFFAWAIAAGLLARSFYRHRDFRLDKRQKKSSSIAPEVFRGAKSFFNLLSHTLIVLFVLSLFLLFFSEQQMINWADEYLFGESSLRLSNEEKPTVIGLVVVSVFLSRLFASFVVKLVDPFQFLTLWLGITLGIIILIGEMVGEAAFQTDIHGLTADSFRHFFYVPLLAFFWAPVFPTLISLVLWNVPGRKRALIAALIVCAVVPAVSLSELFSGLLFSGFNFSVAFFFTLLSVGLLLVIITLIVSDIRKKVKTKKTPDKESGAGIFSFIKR